MLKRLLVHDRDILLLVLIAVPIGAVIGMIDALFGRVLLWITAVRVEHIYWLIPFLSIVRRAKQARDDADF